MWTYLGKAMKPGRSWKDSNGMQYPAQWYARTTDEEKKSVGWVWTDDPVKYDNRFYTGNGTPKALEDVTETIDGEEITTPGLKSVAIAQVKATAGSLLQPSDWKIVKAAEVADYSVDQDTLDYRAAVRAASNTIEAAITAAADLDAFIALHDVPEDGNAPINDWPAEI